MDIQAFNASQFMALIEVARKELSGKSGPPKKEFVTDLLDSLIVAVKKDFELIRGPTDGNDIDNDTTRMPTETGQTIDENNRSDGQNKTTADRIMKLENYSSRHYDQIKQMSRFLKMRYGFEFNHGKKMQQNQDSTKVKSDHGKMNRDRNRNFHHHERRNDNREQNNGNFRYQSRNQFKGTRYNHGPVQQNYFQPEAIQMVPMTTPTGMMTSPYIHPNKFHVLGNQWFNQN